MPEIVISEFMDDGGVGRLSERYSTLYDPELVDRTAALAEALLEARALVVRNRTKVTRALLAGAPALSCVGRLGVGLDNIDLEACRHRAVAVYPATGANDVAVAEYVVTAALALLRGSYAASGDVVAGDWPRQRLIGREVAGKRLGLIGFGGTARQTAERAKALGMSIGAFDPYLPKADLAWAAVVRLEIGTLLETSDVISLHVPLTETTRHLINAKAIARMRPGAVIVNSSRGGVVDETALCMALREGRIGGAALDVFETEPLTVEAGAAFAGVPNLILTPHIAGVTEESNVRVSRVTADKVLSHLERCQ